MGFSPGNAVKYIWRHRDKGTAVADLRKAEQYIEWCIEHRLPANAAGVSRTRLVADADRILAESDVADSPGVYYAIPLICDGRYDAALDWVRRAIVDEEIRPAVLQAILDPTVSIDPRDLR